MLKYFANSILSLTAMSLIVTAGALVADLPKNARAEGEMLPPSFYGRWVERPEQCDFDAGITIVPIDRVLTLSKPMFWRSTNVKVSADGDGYRLDIEGVAEGQPVSLTLNLKLENSGTLVLSGDEGPGRRIKCRE